MRCSEVNHLSALISILINNSGPTFFPRSPVVPLIMPLSCKEALIRRYRRKVASCESLELKESYFKIRSTKSDHGCNGKYGNMREWTK